MYGSECEKRTTLEIEKKTKIADDTFATIILGIMNCQTNGHIDVTIGASQSAMQKGHLGVGVGQKLSCKKGTLMSEQYAASPKWQELYQFAISQITWSKLVKLEPVM